MTKILSPATDFRHQYSRALEQAVIADVTVGGGPGSGAPRLGQGPVARGLAEKGPALRRRGVTAPFPRQLVLSAAISRLPQLLISSTARVARAFDEYDSFPFLSDTTLFFHSKIPISRLMSGHPQVSL